MAYRNGTYIAFDGLGESDPTKSDFRYYATLQAWAANRNIDFNIVDSHDKSYAVKDTSLDATLRSRIRERLSYSRNALIILSSKTRKTGSYLSYEIDQAVDTYDLPLIITYVDYRIVTTPANLSAYWPNTLNSKLSSTSTQAIHIPFHKNAILGAITSFHINSTEKLKGPLTYYNESAHMSFGAATLLDVFQNTKK